MRKTGYRLRKMDEKPLFSGTIKGPYRGFIWRPARPRSWKSYCLCSVTTEERGFFHTYCKQTLQSMYFIVASWPGQFFTPRNGVVGRPFVEARRL
jgi:hypothetical protein